MDSLLEKKLENPRMNLEGKLQHLVMPNALSPPKTISNIKQNHCLILFPSAVGERTIQLILELIQSEHTV